MEAAAAQTLEPASSPMHIEADGDSSRGDDMAALSDPPLYSRGILTTGESGSVRRVLIYLNPFVFAFCLACIYLGMRDVLRLGGFVASGGPYVIAHEAPGWIWLFPVCIILMVMSILLAVFTGAMSGRPNIMILSWSALFISLGWNFLEFGFGIGMGGGIAWGWAVCAALFIPMGAFPLVLVVNRVATGFRRSRQQAAADIPFRGVEAECGAGSWWLPLLIQAGFASGGAVLGTAFFRSLL
jgi:hypothetical protein